MPTVEELQTEIKALKEEMAALRSDVQRLKQKVGPNHPPPVMHVTVQGKPPVKRR